MFDDVEVSVQAPTSLCLDVFHGLDVVLIDGRTSRPSFADDEIFEVEVERRFLLWYKCIRRTKPVAIDQVRTGNREYRPP